MDGLALTAINKPFNLQFFLPSSTLTTKRRFINVSFPRKSRKFRVLASSDDLKLDQWDLLELKFGQLIGEDPKLTIAEIRGRKLNPDASYLEIEKLFYEKGGKSREIEEVPFDVPDEGKSSNSMNGLNLVRPVPKKGIKFDVDARPLETVPHSVRMILAFRIHLELRVKPNLSLKVETEVKKPSQPVRKPVDSNKSSLPNVILRKPTTFSEDDMELPNSSKLKIKPNLSLKMGNKNMNDKFSDITLLKKPELMSGNSSLDKKQEPSADVKAKVSYDVEESSQRTVSVFTEPTNDVTLINWPTQIDFCSNINEQQESSVVGKGSHSDGDFKETGNASLSRDSGLKDYSITGLQPPEQSETGKRGASEEKLVDYHIKFSTEAALQGKPKRLDQSVKATSNFSREEMDFVNRETYGAAIGLENVLATSPIKEDEHDDWKRVDDLVKTGEREEVELISASTRGFIVSFGSLIGFLPYRNLASRWKFLAFESWLRRKGLDPFKYKPNLGIIGNSETANNASLDSSLDQEIDRKIDVNISPDMELEDLLRIYDQEKLQFLSFYVGQKIKVNVVLADRKSRKLIFSVKAKEKEEIVEKKRNLMAKLSIGDVVKCCINKITYFGIFVEVEGVPALIHQTEVSWDATLDPAVYYKVGQPDPLIGALEAVIGDHDSLDGRFEATEADTEWAEMESLIEELQQFEGIQSVSKRTVFPEPWTGSYLSRFIWHLCLRMNTSYLLDRETKRKRYTESQPDEYEHHGGLSIWSFSMLYSVACYGLYS
ncbi:nucleic acid-binding, OB-fold-like protein [Actinidia rufa]|uniref:Nucleic acid-binding, OB-fold-like protein n=1 Tax=Actinidia rufa TaxID=165716 RepID=A0A7J0DKM9_9ERIC|nr:nucleic acid-binding, OB-fold-like protein [Actinidia rufa]